MTEELYTHIGLLDPDKCYQSLWEREAGLTIKCRITDQSLEGVVIVRGISDKRVGYYSIDWNEDYFTLIPINKKPLNINLIL
jgi:hypothetical protein